MRSRAAEDDTITTRALPAPTASLARSTALPKLVWKIGLARGDRQPLSLSPYAAQCTMSSGMVPPVASSAWDQSFTPPSGSERSTPSAYGTSASGRRRPCRRTLYPLFSSCDAKAAPSPCVEPVTSAHLAKGLPRLVIALHGTPSARHSLWRTVECRAARWEGSTRWRRRSTATSPLESALRKSQGCPPVSPRASPRAWSGARPLSRSGTNLSQPADEVSHRVKLVSAVAAETCFPTRCPNLAKGPWSQKRRRPSATLGQREAPMGKEIRRNKGSRGCRPRRSQGCFSPWAS